MAVVVCVIIRSSASSASQTSSGAANIKETAALTAARTDKQSSDRCEEGREDRHRDGAGAVGRFVVVAYRTSLVRRVELKRWHLWRDVTPDR